MSVLLVKDVVRRGGEASEVGLGADAVAAERFAITQLLGVVQPAGDTPVAVRVERVEADAHPCVAARVDLAGVQDRLQVRTHDLGWGGGVGVDEHGVRICFVVALEVTVTQRELEGGLVWALATELADRGIDRRVDGAFDLGQGLGVGLRDDQGHGVLGLAALDGLRLENVGLGQAELAGDHTGRIRGYRHLVLPSFLVVT